jgi:hypothetical protein
MLQVKATRIEEEEEEEEDRIRANSDSTQECPNILFLFVVYLMTL